MGNQEYACARVTVASGTGVTAPVSAEPSTTCDDHDVHIGSLWWDRDGTLNVVFTDDQDPTRKETDERDQRRLEAVVGSRPAPEPGSEVRQLSAGTATLQERTLYLEADGDRTEIDTDVNSVTAAP